MRYYSIELQQVADFTHKKCIRCLKNLHSCQAETSLLIMDLFTKKSTWAKDKLASTYRNRRYKCD